MRFQEFKQIREDLNNETLRSLMSIIDFEKTRSEKLQVDPKISVSRLITLMQNIGYDSFNFSDLESSYEQSPIIQSMISKPEKNKMIEISQDNDDQEPMPNIPSEEDPLADIASQPLTGTEQPMVEPGMDQMQPEMPLSSEPSGPIESPQGTIKTVQSMAKKALKRRQ